MSFAYGLPFSIHETTFDFQSSASGASGYSARAHAATLQNVHERAIYSIDWASEATCAQAGCGVIATGGADDAIVLLRASAAAGSSIVLEQIRTIGDAHAGDVNSVAWRPAPEGRPPSLANMLASCGDDGSVRLWRTV